MAGCAMIGQSIINVKSGGRGRLSSLVAGTLLLIMVVLDAWLALIPMAALVAVMIMVSIGTFSWQSVTKFHTMPITYNLVMLATVITVVMTHNLALGVLVGVLLSAIFFAHKISHLMAVRVESTSSDDEITYQVRGQLFFASSQKFINAFDFKHAFSKVVIDLSHSHIWDPTAVDAVDKVVLKYKEKGQVLVVGMNKATSDILDKFAIHSP